jgi:hypothetical protein
MHPPIPLGTTVMPDPSCWTLAMADSGPRSRPLGEALRLPVEHGPSETLVRSRAVRVSSPGVSSPSGSLAFGALVPLSRVSTGQYRGWRTGPQYCSPRRRGDLIGLLSLVYHGSPKPL